jgi:two-component system, OmpR family, KDP operon response regulator KdpE
MPPLANDQGQGNAERAAGEGAGRVILAIEDEAALLRFLRATLPAHGYRLVEAQTGGQGLIEASTRAPDVILLDLGLPDIDGVAVARKVREWSAVPIIVLSARGQEHDKIEALDAGADDYLTKPFGVGELLARIRVAVRKQARAGDGAPGAVFRSGGLSVDLAARRVMVDEREVRLTRTEFNLLAMLVKNAGRVLTHRQLLRDVWGPGAVGQPHYVRVYMGQLRHKLEADPARPRYLQTEVGVGYRLKTDN